MAINDFQSTEDSLNSSNFSSIANAMLEASPDVIFRAKSDGTIIDFHHPKNTSILPKELLALPNIQDVLFPENEGECLSLISNAIKTNELQLFDHATIYNGFKYSVEGRIVSRSEDEVIIIVRDFPERRNQIASSVTYNIAKKVSSEEIDLAQLSEYIQEELGRFMATENFFIALKKGEDTIEFPYNIYHNSNEEISFSRELSNGLTEHIIRTGEKVLLNDREHLDFEKKNKIKILGTMSKSWIGVPIYIKKEVIGVIACLSNNDAEKYNPTHLDLLSYVGSQIGMFINQVTNEKIKKEFTQTLERTVHERTHKLEIAQNESKYQLDTLNEVALVSVTDISGKITYANEIFCDTSGYFREELIGENHRILKSGKHSDEFYLNIWNVITNGDIWKGEILNKTKQGNFYWVQTTIVPFFDINGEIEKYIAVRFDITKEKTLVERLEASLEKEKELGELKSRFVATTSHQFRTPMTIIQSNSELLNLIAKNSECSIREKLETSTARIRTEVTRMTSLLDEILILGKINAGKLNTNKSLSNLVSICEELCEKFNLIQEDSRSIELSISGKNQDLFIDKELISHALRNLISNAMKYSSERNPELKLIFEKNKIEISVKDYGIGIPENELDIIFQAFHRAKNIGEISGTGLGLTIVKEFVELNNGTISVKSEMNKETVFSISIPLEQITS